MSSGFSKPGLARLHDIMAGHVAAGRAPGLIAALSRRGETHVDVIGAQAFGGESFGGDAMRRDTIFRITSMTKPVTAVAAMILVEECKLRLDDPVDRFLPELADRRVLKRLDGPVDDTTPAVRPITLRDLLTFRSGYGFFWASPERYPILKAIADLQILGFGPPDPSAPLEPDEWLRRLATLPLLHQPGAEWHYNTGSYILGVLIARVAGQSFANFLHDRIFAPLGMKDTGFYVPAEKLDRLAASYWVSEQDVLQLYDGVADSRWRQPPVFADGGAGLVSTVDDYLAFAQMLLNRGKLGSIRILSRASVELMTMDHLTPAQKAAAPFLADSWDHRGWGFGVSVVTGRDGIGMNPGRYGWDGGFGTSWANDPSEELVAILMTQRAVYPTASVLYQDFWTLAYQAIDD